MLVFKIKKFSNYYLFSIYFTRLKMQEYRVSKISHAMGIIGSFKWERFHYFFLFVGCLFLYFFDFKISDK